MFEFKRKYLSDSLEPLEIFWLTHHFPVFVFGNYLNLHKLRHFLSPLGINGFILGYAFIGLLFLLQELLIGDPAARQFILIILATHVTYDVLLNMEVLRLGIRSETEHYTCEYLFHEHQLTFEQRIQQLEQQGRVSEVRRVRHIARNSGGFGHLRWIGGIRIREKGTSHCWMVRITDGDDYESHLAQSNRRADLPCVLPIFQEVRDRRLSPRRRQQVLRRLALKGLNIEPCGGPQSVEVLSESD